VAPNSTLKSRPLVINDPDPTEFADNVRAVVVYTSTNDATERELFLSGSSGSMPMPPPGSTFTLNGTTRDASSNATIRDVRIEIVSGPNTKRNTKTDRNGKYSLASLGPGTITVKASKSGFEPMTHTILFLASKPLDFVLSKAAGARPGAATPLAAGRVTGPKRLQVEIR